MLFRSQLAIENQAATGQLSEAVVVDAPGAADASHPAPEKDRLQLALSMRRPISKLLMDVSNCADSEIHVEDLKFASTDRVVVTGIVQGDTRQDALKAIARFSRGLGDIAYVQAGGDEEITEVPRLKNCFKFRLGMKWRNG